MKDFTSENPQDMPKNAENAAGIFRPENTPEATVNLQEQHGLRDKPLDHEFDGVPGVNVQIAAQEIKKRIAELRAFLQES